MGGDKGNKDGGGDDGDDEGGDGGMGRDTDGEKDEEE